jgi:CYTH domain-containing protein
MAKEIERKYRITKINKKLLKRGIKIFQGYLSIKPEVRIRIKGSQGYITIKSSGSIARDEFEYEIPLRDVRTLYRMCPYRLEKTRYKVGQFEIDVFEGKLKGLILAEIELEYKNKKIKLAVGIEGYEVTHNKDYKNKNLATLNNLSELKKK